MTDLTLTRRQGPLEAAVGKPSEFKGRRILASSTGLQCGKTVGSPVSCRGDLSFASQMVVAFLLDFRHVGGDDSGPNRSLQSSCGGCSEQWEECDKLARRAG